MKNLKLLCTAWMAIALFVCCTGSGGGETQPEAAKLVDAVYEAHDYERLLRVADSLQRAGLMNDAEAFYWQGYACDRMMRRRMAELYWKTAMRDTETSTDATDLAFYAKSATRLTNLLSVRGEFKAALDVALPAVERIEALGCDTTSDYTNLLIYIGCCQSRFGLNKELADANFERAYQMHLDNIERHHSDEAYKNAIAGLINIAYNCNMTRLYDAALKWTDRFGQLVSQYELRTDANTNYADKQWARYDIYRAVALEGMFRSDEAAQVYSDYQKTKFSHTAEGRIMSNDYLLAARRWQEAADNYSGIDHQADGAQGDYSLEYLQQSALKKFQANMLAGRADSAVAVSMAICQRLDSAIVLDRRMDAEEHAVIREKEAELAQQQAESVSRRTNTLIAVMVVAGLCLIGYILNLRRSRQKLKKAHNRLVASSSQQEKSTADRERRQSEMRIALDVQAAFTPKVFSGTPQMSIYASMATAEKYIGEFYDFFIRDGQLFFCMGDTTVQGNAATLVMATAKVLFRSIAAAESRPDDIVNQFNSTMAKIGGPAAALTLFVGALDLTTGRLSYCNAAHEAPLLVGSSVAVLPVDMNKALGGQAVGSYTAQETTLEPGTILFLYTKGLLAVENKAGQPFGLQRIKGEALQTVSGLDPAPKAFVERMTSTLHRFTGEDNKADVPTMLAVRYVGQADAGSSSK